MTQTIRPFLYWGIDDDADAKSAGWCLDVDGDTDRIVIRRVDNPSREGLDYDEPIFPNDEMAQDFVAEQADGGDRGALLAIFLLGNPASQPLMQEPPKQFLSEETVSLLSEEISVEEHPANSGKLNVWVNCTNVSQNLIGHGTYCEDTGRVNFRFYSSKQTPLTISDHLLRQLLEKVDQWKDR